MANEKWTKKPSGIDQVEVEPLTDDDLESASGGLNGQVEVTNVTTACLPPINNATTGC